MLWLAYVATLLNGGYVKLAGSIARLLRSKLAISVVSVTINQLDIKQITDIHEMIEIKRKLNSVSAYIVMYCIMHKCRHFTSAEIFVMLTIKHLMWG